MIRRTFLKGCASLVLTVGAFYGGMGISLPAAPKEDAFNVFEKLMRTHIGSAVRDLHPDDDPVWKVIQNYDQGVIVINP